MGCLLFLDSNRHKTPFDMPFFECYHGVCGKAAGLIPLYKRRRYSGYSGIFGRP